MLEIMGELDIQIEKISNVKCYICDTDKTPVRKDGNHNVDISKYDKLKCGN